MHPMVSPWGTLGVTSMSIRMRKKAKVWLVRVYCISVVHQCGIKAILSLWHQYLAIWLWYYNVSMESFVVTLGGSLIVTTQKGREDKSFTQAKYSYSIVGVLQSMDSLDLLHDAMIWNPITRWIRPLYFLFILRRKQRKRKRNITLKITRTRGIEHIISIDLNIAIFFSE